MATSVAQSLFTLSSNVESQPIIARNKEMRKALIGFLKSSDETLLKLATATWKNLASHPSNTALLSGEPELLAALRDVMGRVKTTEIRKDAAQTLKVLSVPKKSTTILKEKARGTVLTATQSKMAPASGFRGVGLAAVHSNRNTSASSSVTTANITKVQTAHTVVLYCSDMDREVICESVRRAVVRVPGVLSVQASAETRKIIVCLRVNVPLSKITEAVCALKLTPGPFVVEKKAQTSGSKSFDSFKTPQKSQSKRHGAAAHPNQENRPNVGGGAGPAPVDAKSLKTNVPQYIDDEPAMNTQEANCAVTLFDHSTLAGRLAAQKQPQKTKKKTVASAGAGQGSGVLLRLGRMLW